MRPRPRPRTAPGRRRRHRWRSAPGSVLGFPPAGVLAGPRAGARWRCAGRRRRRGQQPETLSRPPRRDALASGIPDHPQGRPRQPRSRWPEALGPLEKSRSKAAASRSPTSARLPSTLTRPSRPSRRAAALSLGRSGPSPAKTWAAAGVGRAAAARSRRGARAVLLPGQRAQREHPTTSGGDPQRRPWSPPDPGRGQPTRVDPVGDGHHPGRAEAERCDGLVVTDRATATTRSARRTSRPYSARRGRWRATRPSRSAGRRSGRVGPCRPGRYFSGSPPVRLDQVGPPRPRQPAQGPGRPRGAAAPAWPRGR